MWPELKNSGKKIKYVGGRGSQSFALKSFRIYGKVRNCRFLVILFMKQPRSFPPKAFSWVSSTWWLNPPQSLMSYMWHSYNSDGNLSLPAVLKIKWEGRGTTCYVNTQCEDNVGSYFAQNSLSLPLCLVFYSGTHSETHSMRSSRWY